MLQRPQLPMGQVQVLSKKVDNGEMGGLDQYNTVRERESCHSRDSAGQILHWLSFSGTHFLGLHWLLEPHRYMSVRVQQQ